MSNQFSIVQQECSQRYSDLKVFWSDVKSKSAIPPKSQPFIYLSGTGFTIVYLYSVIEFSVNRGVKQLAQLISDYSVRTCDIAPALIPLVHEPKLEAIRGAGKSTRLSSRVNLAVGLFSLEKAKIHETLLGPELQNVWHKSVVETFALFGITESCMADPRSGSYLDRVVNDRNAIAHGRERPETIGGSYTIGDINNIIFRLEMETNYIIGIFEQYYNDRLFISRSHRSRYIKKEKLPAA